MTCRSAPDPFAPDLAGELAHLAARVGDDPEVILGPLERVADSLGHPPTLAVPLAWARLMVAVSVDDAAGARKFAHQLTSLSESAPVASSVTAGDAARLLARAARSFADVLDGVVAADEVKAVGDRLIERGLVFEAARLIGAAGLRCTDPATARGLLHDLRRLRAAQLRPSPSGSRSVAELSEREWEVARGVLEGRTHREIGAQLYISAKTVEHHVARIRQKLGATSKAELIAALKDELARREV